MSDITKAAINLLYSDISVIPVKEDKTPPIKWETFQSHPLEEEEAPRLFDKAWGIAVISGGVSCGLESIDFDAHGRDITEIYNKFMSDPGVNTIMKRHQPYVERTPNGGYHLIYTYEADSSGYAGSLKLSNWEDGTTMIETRGSKGYTIVAPTPRYTPITGGLDTLPRLLYDERSYLIEYARSFNQFTPKKSTYSEVPSDSHHHTTDPVSWFNWNKQDYAKELLSDAGWTLVSTDREYVEFWRRPGKDDGHSATWGKRPGHLYVFSSSAEPFQNECYYNPFQILTILRFEGCYHSALKWVVNKYFSEDLPYIRVGTKYFRKVVKADRFKIETLELKVWEKEEIKQDHGKASLDRIPKFDDFILVPDNLSYNPIIRNCYNLYREFRHKPSPGSWRWTEVLLRHIFGEQYSLGLRYMQILYLHPDHLMPILVLVSRERQTGKTTFINWINMIFGDNVANVSPEDLVSQFNYSYAASNIITVEEAIIEKNHTVERIKAMATSKLITVNQKYINQYRTPFFGKFILTSNNEDKFARIDQEEIRFFVRKVSAPTEYNHAIESDLVREIPAFLHYLSTLPPVDFSVDRTGFMPSELDNDSLKSVKDASRSDLYKELSIIIEDLFLNEMAEADQFYADAAAFKDRFFDHNQQINRQYIRTVIREQMKLEPLKDSVRFDPFGQGPSRTGRPFLFKREQFTSTPSDKTTF
jgi:hypothetical protein